MSFKHLTAVEVVYESQIWHATRPIKSVHRHLGYVTYESDAQIKITPELTIRADGRSLRIEHETKPINKLSVPKPVVFPLETTNERTDIIQIDYSDPFHKDEILSKYEAEILKPSILRLLGYVVKERQRYISLAIGSFHYKDGTVDYETVHVIPKTSIIEKTFLRKKNEKTSPQSVVAKER